MRTTETIDNKVSLNVIVIRLIIIAFSYFITGRLGLELAIVNSHITLIWLPTGIAVAAFFHWGWRYFPAVWLGSLTANVAIGTPLLIASGISIGGTLAPLIAVALLRRWQFNADIVSWRDVPVFVASGSIAMMLSATGGVTALILGGIIPWADIGWSWLAWWLGDSVGVIVGGMAFITFKYGDLIQLLSDRFRKEFLISMTFVALIGVAWIIIPAYPVGHIFLIPFLIIVLVWIALRLGACPASFAVLMLSTCASVALAHGRGPFLDENIQLAISKLWGFITTLSTVTMLVSAFSAERKRMEQQLRDSEAFANSILNSLSWNIAVLDSKGRIVSVNNAWQQFAKDNGSGVMLGENYFDVCQKAFDQPNGTEATAVHNGIESVLSGAKDSFHLEYPCHSPTKQAWFYMTVSPLQGTQHGAVVSHENITDRKQAEIQLRIAATVFESHEGMLIADADNIVLNVNPAFTKITGYSVEDVVGRTPSVLKSGRHDKEFYAAMWQSLLTTGSWQGEIYNRRKNGEIYPEWLSITAVKDSNDTLTHYVAMLTDITERKVSEQTINQLSFYDPLTQLPNRRLIFERLKHAVDVSHRTGDIVALLMLDLDKFKAVNDNFGHAIGDKLLQRVAKRVSTHLSNVDMLARLGADEFMILLENVDHYETVARIAKAIIDDLNRPFILYQTHSTTISTSIGIALYPQHGDSAEALMDNVDVALYHAKDQGRSCFAYFSDELTQKARERLALEARLRRAIEKQQLQVYFQGQIDINSGQIIGAEALVRWIDPIHGCIAPNQFIALAEETGLIFPLGEWVLRETCQLGQQWLNAGLPPITLAVNVSPYQFNYGDINALVTEILNETGFPVHLLELEITESGLMENQQQAMTILEALHAQGVKLAIDDFGTGYSSLAYLKFFPLDVLKIDKSFIDDIPFLASDIAITSTIIAMAHHLGFKVLAEGVENQAQLDFLREHGCDMYQGYLYSKPVPATDFTKLLRNQTNI